MKNKLSKILPIVKTGYDWKYCSIGGVTRVRIESGEDIAHLGELDEKMWTVLSCPVKGLEFNERTLALMDSDNDNRIRVHEVVAAAQWLCRVLVNADLLKQGSSELNLSDINVENAEGKELREMATHILETLGKPSFSLTLSDLEDYRKLVDERIKVEFENRTAVAIEQPYGEASEALLAAVSKLRDKVNDFYLRCRLIRYNEDSATVLGMSMERLGAISSTNLAVSSDELASYPLAHATKDAILHLDGGINPVWQSAVDALRQALVDANEECTTLDESQWNRLCERLSVYETAKNEAASQRQKELDELFADELAISTPIEKLLLLYRDFYKLLHNYVIMSDFYSTDKKAIFQAGKLYIDQRCCELCLRVADMSKHADTMASLSGMYLVYCTCSSKVKNANMEIVAVLTDGDVDDLRVGKNALFYDRNGLDWDATVIKIVDNPISIRQAFWSPYKKFWNWCMEKINKSAAEKESKNMEYLTAGAEKITEETKAHATNPELVKKEEKKQAFDIAKFAGIFAAIGMAIGYIVGAVSGLAETFSAKPLSALIFIVVIILVISGPSMFLAWLKLRKRNLGPVLNANGWAINSSILVNVPFGATLTSMAKYPTLAFNDPFIQKKTPAWRKWMWCILLVAVVTFVVLYFKGCLPWQKSVEEPVATELIEKCSVTAPNAVTSDTVTVTESTVKQ